MGLNNLKFSVHRQVSSGYKYFIVHEKKGTAMKAILFACIWHEYWPVVGVILTR
jgi:hypothetical protein